MRISLVYLAMDLNIYTCHLNFIEEKDIKLQYRNNLENIALNSEKKHLTKIQNKNLFF